MPGRLTTVVKGTFCGSTDAEIKNYVDREAKQKIEEWLADFEDTNKDLKTIAKDWGIWAAPQDKHYDEFFGVGVANNKKFFPGLDTDEMLDVVRGAFIQGFRVCLYQKYPTTPRPRPKTVVLYWIAGGPAFEAYVSDSDKEVHIILMTPDPQNVPPPPAPPGDRDENIWVVATKSRVQAIRDRAPNYQYDLPESIGNLTSECQKVKSY